MNKFLRSSHPYAVITIIFWSFAYVMTRLSLHYFTAFSLGFLRYLTASAALVVVVLVMRMKRPALRDLPWFLLAGFCGIGLYMVVFNLGCRTVNSSTSSVILATVPLVTAVYARVIFKEQLSAVQWLSFAVSLLGVAIITVLSGGFSVNIGLFWLTLAVLLISAFNIVQRKLTRTYSALQTSSFSIFTGTVMLAVFLPSSVHQAAQAPAVAWVYLLVLGVGSSAIAYCTWAAAYARAKKTSSVTNYMFVTPFTASLLGIILGGETIPLATVMGGIVIFAGLVLFGLSGLSAERRLNLVSAAARPSGADVPDMSAK